jgi:hypothetical protein
MRRAEAGDLVQRVDRDRRGFVRDRSYASALILPVASNHSNRSKSSTAKPTCPALWFLVIVNHRIQSTQFPSDGLKPSGGASIFFAFDF